MILGKKYEGPEVDMWSLGIYLYFMEGVILFALLCGHLPFDDDNMKELYKKIASGSYKCPDYLLPSNYSIFKQLGARHLISRLITVDPKKRATLHEVLNHPWVQENYDIPPPNFIPDRAVITDPSQLSKDITNRLQIFGYKISEIHEAFSPNQDLSRPNAIRATYHLLSEMVIRERARLLNEQKIMADKSRKSAATTQLQSQSHSFQQMGQSLPCIPDSIPPVSKIPQDLEKASESFRNKEFVSATALSVKDNQRISIPNDQKEHKPNHTKRLSLIPSAPIVRNGYQSYSTASKNQDLKNLHINSRNLENNNRRDSEDEGYNRPKTAGDNTSQKALQHFEIPRSGINYDRRGSRASATEKIKEELRSVSGWFLNVTTTSSKPPEVIRDQLISVLKENHAVIRQETQFSLICEINITASPLVNVKNETKNENNGSQDNDYFESNEQFSPGSSWFKGKPQTVSFQVEICQVPRMNLHGLHFKRISGGVWNYKKVCNKILSQMAL